MLHANSTAKFLHVIISDDPRCFMGAAWRAVAKSCQAAKGLDQVEILTHFYEPDSKAYRPGLKN